MQIKCDATPKSKQALAYAQGLLKKDTNGVAIKSLDKFEVLCAALAETLKLPSHWTKQEVISRVHGAVVETVRAEDKSWERFVAALNDESRELLHSQFRRYEMWTKVKLSDPRSLRPIRFKIEGVSVSFVQRVPRPLRFKLLEVPGIDPVAPNFPQGGAIVVARGRYRSDAQAGEGLYQRISDACGLINVAVHRHRRTYSSGERKPKATLLLGKYHFLFRDGVSVHENGIWYNPDFREDFWKQSSFATKKLVDATPYVRQVLRDLKRSPSGSRIKAALGLLHEGWQSHDLNQRILRAWTAFETLLSRSPLKTDDYETIMDRALFIMQEPNRERLAFNLAVTYRNRFVHENGSAGAAESVAEYLDEYLISIIEWLLMRNIRFESHDRFLDMLDTPLDSLKTKNQIVDRRRGLKIRSGA